MNPHVSDAIILRHFDYGEADRIVAFLTPDHGFLKGFARNARKSRRRFGAALEPFARVRLQWQAGRGELVSLREAELIDLRPGLRADLGAIALGGYGCELAEALLGQTHGFSETFELLESFLVHLAGAGPSPVARLLLELRLLNEAGYVPHLLHCSDCHASLTDGEAAFDAVRGGAVCLSCAGSAPRLAVGTLGSLARLLRVPLTVFDGIRLGERTLAEGSAALAAALRLHLPHPLRSVAFLDQIMDRAKDSPG